jgi:hypothetical protein
MQEQDKSSSPLLIQRISIFLDIYPALGSKQSENLINTSSELPPARSIYRPMVTKEGNRRYTKLAGIKREIASSPEAAG